jgi:hypothetical protein
MESGKTNNTFSAEIGARAVRMVREHRGECIRASPVYSASASSLPLKFRRNAKMTW